MLRSLMFLSETSTGIPVWLAGDAVSPLVKCTAIAATSSGFAVSLHHAGDRGAPDGYSSAIDIGRQSEKTANSAPLLDERTVREAVEQGQIVPYFSADRRLPNWQRSPSGITRTMAKRPGTIGPDVFMPVITR
ncbi:hypothetical protein PXJ20_31165 [Paraburkholderia sp. A1RI_3L]|uniref:hypothetical protein n=1 Tax=Paraburkholderia TaxID=1822464 RepID=UPI003B79A888